MADSIESMMKGNQEFILIDEQKLVYETALAAIRSGSTTNDKYVYIVQGGPGTGKSVVGVNILANATINGRNASYVTKNATPRAVAKVKLARSHSREKIDALFQNSDSFVDSEMNEYDVLCIDEAHRLTEKGGFYQNLGENQIKELIHAAKVAIFFIDEDQQVTWRDIGSVEEIKKWAAEFDAIVIEDELASQFRCNGSDGFLAWVDNTLQIRETANFNLSGIDYDFKVIDSPNELFEQIRDKNQRNKSRLVAGYCWEWMSKKDKNAQDIVFPAHNFSMQWNLTEDGNLYAISDDSINQIGCIHTVQGLDLEYVGVIIGPDLLVRNGVVQTHPENRAKQDKSLNGYKRDLKAKVPGTEEKADRIIRNTYRALMTRGMKGCYIFCEDEETREYFKNCIE